MKKKVKEWLRRYIPAEIFATIGALLGAGVIYWVTNNAIGAAYAGTIGENIGYYGFIVSRDLVVSRRRHKKNNKKFGFLGFVKNVRNLFIEFGPAEILDSLVVRPFAMFIFPIILGDFFLGILVGKIAADVVFYIPTIISYELRKKHFID